MREREEKKLAQQAAQAKYRANNKDYQRQHIDKSRSKAEQEKYSTARLTSIYDSALLATV